MLQLSNLVAKVFHRVAFEVECSQINDGGIADLQLLESESPVDGKKIWRCLIKRDAPSVVFAISLEPGDRRLDLFFRSDRIAERDGEIRGDAIRDEAIAP